MSKFLSIFILFLNITLASRTDFGCRTNATILRQLDREGFHIDVYSLIELVVDVETAWKWDNCTFILREKIPSSFYANPDQLSELSRSGVIQACSPDRVNVETPEHLSAPHTVFVYGNLKRSHNLLYGQTNLPIHLRYHKPKTGGGYSMTELNSPVLLINCPNIDCKNLIKIKTPCVMCESEQCTWMKFPFKTNNHNITVIVPVGNLNHLWFVKPITYLLTFGGCLYVILALMVVKKNKYNQHKIL